jgi:hypothetical protein
MVLVVVLLFFLSENELARKFSLSLDNFKEVQFQMNFFIAQPQRVFLPECEPEFQIALLPLEKISCSSSSN